MVLGKMRLSKLGEEKTEEAKALYDLAQRAVAAQAFERAVRLLDNAIVIDPIWADAYYKRGNALKALGRMHEAIGSYDCAVQLKPDFAFAYCNRGVTQQALGMNAEALASYDLAIQSDPADAMSHYNRALVLQEYSRWDEVMAGYERAVAIDPGFADAQYNRSLALLYCGYLEQGWRHYEWRWQNMSRLGIGELRDFPEPRWLGEQPIRGKRLLLFSEGGFGDTVQFCRYASLAAARGAEVYLEIQPALRGLLAQVEGASKVLEKGGDLPQFDYQCPLMSLPLAFGTTLNTVPPPAKGLRIDETTRMRCYSRREQPGGPRIGLVWSGNPHNANDRRRSIRLAELIAHLPTGYRYFRLQKDLRIEDREALESCQSIVSMDEDVQDFVNTAALCQCMDLVITVDTSVAHLSGTLGCPTWVMLPSIPDWRWLRGRHDSPWYPSMKLFRQESSESWSDVLARVVTSLRREFPARTSALT